MVRHFFSNELEMSHSKNPSTHHSQTNYTVFCCTLFMMAFSWGCSFTMFSIQLNWLIYIFYVYNEAKRKICHNYGIMLKWIETRCLLTLFRISFIVETCFSLLVSNLIIIFMRWNNCRFKLLNEVLEKLCCIIAIVTTLDLLTRNLEIEHGARKSRVETRTKKHCL